MAGSAPFYIPELRPQISLVGFPLSYKHYEAQGMSKPVAACIRKHIR